MTALIRAANRDTVYLARNKSILAKIMVRTRKKRADREALVDSGANECFINPKTVKQLGVKTKQLKFPRKVKNVDGTYNKAGRITEAAIL